tara:strand:+ start:662 stop:1147 length:486 start_codon:yes stop_codon:yes gene_type:complete
MNIILIAAIANNGVIGKEGKIPWYLKEDLQHFKNLTTGSIVIMGRKTYESIGKPLPNRNNIVLTRNPKNIKNIIEVTDTQEALNTALKINKDIYVIGGEFIYREFLPMAVKMYLTEIDLDVKGGDVFFPYWSKKEWEEISRFSKKDIDQNISYSFVEYERK